MATENGENKSGMSLGVQAAIWIAVSLASAFLGGGIALYLEAPFYFGFLFGLVFVGQIALFALAANVAKRKR